jgi:hypothetical protein
MTAISFDFSRSKGIDPLASPLKRTKINGPKFSSLINWLAM